MLPPALIRKLGVHLVIASHPLMLLDMVTLENPPPRDTTAVCVPTAAHLQNNPPIMRAFASQWLTRDDI